MPNSFKLLTCCNSQTINFPISHTLILIKLRETKNFDVNCLISYAFFTISFYRTTRNNAIHHKNTAYSIRVFVHFKLLVSGSLSSTRTKCVNALAIYPGNYWFAYWDIAKTRLKIALNDRVLYSIRACLNVFNLSLQIFTY